MQIWTSIQNINKTGKNDGNFLLLIAICRFLYFKQFHNNKIKIDSVENTAVIFDTNTRHRGVPQTDVDRRLVMNITYFER